MRILMGKGVLSWAPHERRGDRYGAIFLMQEGTNSFSGYEAPTKLVGIPAAHQLGRLIVVVTEARKSTHIGDLFHGVFPSTPDIGEEITLGKGCLTYDKCKYGYHHIGLAPEDDRKTQWLDIHALYRVHEQSVELYFEPEDKEAKYGEC